MGDRPSTWPRPPGDDLDPQHEVYRPDNPMLPPKAHQCCSHALVERARAVRAEQEMVRLRVTIAELVKKIEELEARMED